MDSFFGIGMMELFFIALIALIVLGPERMPGAIREVMKTIRYVRNLSNELTSQFSEEFKDLDDLNPQKIMKEIAGDLDEEETPKKAAAAKPGAAKTATKPAGVKPVAPKSAAKPAAKPATAAKPASKPAEDKPSESKTAETKEGEQADAKAASAAKEPDAAADASELAPPEEAVAKSDGETQPENTILPQSRADEASPPAIDADETVSASADDEEPLKAETESASEPPAGAESATDDGAAAELKPAPAAKRAALSVNGKNADPKGEG